MGGALAWRDGFFRLDATLVCLCTALLLQIGSNLAYYWVARVGADRSAMVVAKIPVSGP